MVSVEQKHADTVYSFMIKEYKRYPRATIAWTNTTTFNLLTKWTGVTINLDRSGKVKVSSDLKLMFRLMILLQTM